MRWPANVLRESGMSGPDFSICGDTSIIIIIFMMGQSILHDKSNSCIEVSLLCLFDCEFYTQDTSCAV